MKYLSTIFNIECDDKALCAIIRDVLADSLAAVGFEAFEETSNGLTGYIQEDLFHHEELDTTIQQLPFEGVIVSYQLEKVEDKDWNETWESQGFEPITIDEQVTIYDAKNTPNDATFPTPICVGIEARQAFGTGTHQTTRMVVRSLLNIELHGKRLLDCGCGTGILSIVASKIGACEVVAYDIDEWSVENTRHNAQLNKVDNILVFTGDASVLTHISGVFDVVVANINRNILLQDLSAYKEAMRANGLLVLSGFYSADAPIIAKRAHELGLTLINQRTEDDWCCIVLK